jgi:cytochrome c553
MSKFAALFCAGSFLLVGGCLVSRAHAAADAKDGVAFFEKNIRPVLVESCYKCHSAKDVFSSYKGNLRVDNMQSLRKGGSSGNPAVLPGDMEKSELIKSIRYLYTGEDAKKNMPSKSDKVSKKLPDAVIKDFERWVKMGAPVPEDFKEPAKGTAVEKDAADGEK